MCKIDPKIDIAFKKLFGVEGNKDLLISLINSMLSAKDKVSDIVLKNPYNLPDYLSGKLSILDIKAEDKNGRRYNVEMQILGHDDYGLRTLFYLAKAFTEQIGNGGQYRSLNKTVAINIVDFDFFEEDKDESTDKSYTEDKKIQKKKKDDKIKIYHREIVLMDAKTHVRYPQLDYFSIHFVELPNYKAEKPKTMLECWMTFLNKASEFNIDELSEELKTEEIIKAQQELTKMNFNEKEREHYDRQQILLMDEHARLETAKNKGKIEGKVEGKIEGKIEIAKKMINKGLDNETIAEFTDLELTLIEQIRQEL